MADRTIQNSWFRAAIQTARDVEPTWAPTHVVPLVGPPRWSIIQDGVDRNILGPSFGASERLPGQDYVRYAPTVEMASSGVAGTPPPWDALLRGCGMARTDITGTHARCEYRPISANFEFLALRFTEGGLQRRVINALGTATLNLRAGDIPRFEFEYLGARLGTPAASSLGFDYDPAWNNVQVITDDNSGDVRLGCTYSVTTGAVSGGQDYPSFGLTLRLGVDVQHSPILGRSGATIAARRPEIELDLYLTTAQEIQLDGFVRQITYTSLGWNIGTVSGRRLALFFPRVQLAEFDSQEMGGRLMKRFRVYPVPTGVARDDDLRLICR